MTIETKYTTSATEITDNTMETLKTSPTAKIHITLRLAPSEHQQIRELAEKHGVPFTVALRAALEVGLTKIFDVSAPPR